MTAQQHASDPGARFIEGFAEQVGLDVALFTRPGTTVVGRDDRAGSEAAACYRVGDHLILWVDPAVEQRLAHLNDDATAGDDALAARLTEVGFELFAAVDMRVLAKQVPTAAPPTDRYQHQTLTAENPADMDRIRRFAERSDEDELEDAALEHVLDGSAEFEEDAIHVIVDAAAGDDELVAYASACPWEWDRGFGDIGVLVDPKHRGAGLGRFVAAKTVAQLVEQGSQPLYRHEQTNDWSRRIANALGFELVTSLAYYRLSGPTD